MDPEIAECLTLARVELELARSKIAADMARLDPWHSAEAGRLDQLLAAQGRVLAALAALSEPPE